MSNRPIANKQIRAVRKLARQTPVRYIDLIDWLKTRGHAQTSGEARRIIAAGRVQSESHPLGVDEVEEFTISGIRRLFGTPRVPAALRDSIVVRQAGRKA